MLTVLSFPFAVPVAFAGELELAVIIMLTAVMLDDLIFSTKIKR